VRHVYARTFVLPGPSARAHSEHAVVPSSESALKWGNRTGPRKLCITNITLSINENNLVPARKSQPGLLSTKIIISYETVPIITHSFEVLHSHALVQLFIVDDSSKYSYSIYIYMCVCVCVFSYIITWTNIDFYKHLINQYGALRNSATGPENRRAATVPSSESCPSADHRQSRGPSRPGRIRRRPKLSGDSPGRWLRWFGPRAAGNRVPISRFDDRWTR
jgi:hypothetical protein